MFSEWLEAMIYVCLLLIKIEAMIYVCLLLIKITYLESLPNSKFDNAN
jgi:hypothetical protein